MAEQVMRMPALRVQRQMAEEEEEEERLLQAKPLVQRRVGGGETGGVAPPIVDDVLSSRGRPLDPDVRVSMERRFGHDFSQVRVYTDARASMSAQALQARAYTVGNHVVFGPGQYHPRIASGRRLLSHELTHTIQQSGGSRGPIAITAAVPGLHVAREEGDWQWDVVGDRHYYYDDVQGAEDRVEGARRDHGWTETRIETMRINGQERYHVVGRASTPRQTPPSREQQPQTGEQRPRSREQEQPSGAQQPPPGSQPPQQTTAVPTPMRVGGSTNPSNPYRVIRIAWTLDDGPTAFTSGMQRALGSRPGTWFIMRNRLGAGQTLQASLRNLAQLQSQGQEIAIHSMHPDRGHGAWFPARVSDGVPQVYQSVNDAIADLNDFVTLLRGAGITVRFVRLPGGLIS
ncbi:MAG TPA: DUF4157 domain-containing protein, partial [Anaerolineae bacterium]|nr:DUF4157 domain-containing protein [Anaerolineae bacterium]